MPRSLVGLLNECTYNLTDSNYKIVLVPAFNSCPNSCPLGSSDEYNRLGFLISQS